MFLKKSKNFASYENVSINYLKRRQLQGSTGAFLLWSLGVGAVISGNFYGWNYGLIVGGFWGLTIATFLMAIMYICMVYTLAELSSALPHAGGFYSFTRNAFGPFWGFLCGVIVTVEYVLGTSALVFAMSNYLKPVIPSVPSYVVWVIIYALFTGVCILSLEFSLQVSLFMTLVAIMILGIFYFSMSQSGVFKLELLFNIPPDPGQSAKWLPKGWKGVFAAMPYAIWFYQAIELLPMASEETEDVPRNMPKGLISGILTLILVSIFTLVLNTGVGGGAAAIGKSNIPLAEGLQAYFGKGSTSDFLTTLSLTLGLGASLCSIVYGYGRILFSISRAGYLPRWISVTSKNNIPYRALILCTILGLICVVIVEQGKVVAVDAVILNMTVFAAVISYILVMLSYIKLKLTSPDLPRPYQSPFGIQGAFVATALAVLALIACFYTRDYQPGIWGTVIAIVLAVLYYFVYGRHRLVAQAPEEAAALNKRT
ncbi:amino acid permease [Aetokthonos hydrillicola Thurmond2011]|jgi:ethanolamine permease|uniref:Amino acid permease n=1 Tax=Aetokthonos hydrillicola Thurmond2011 TaxID=2712845 RepID=A0AAP5I392_9CYAN|nr:amino acid permease [Aetokthonos hydrillicola]MBW4584949.1 amino acid permease [Aetokthonos hydrillicola CCALA 1050]MDR9894292.1 amino acid permease [Aetokthonos hydrillicola Thurmond2011]